MEACGGLTISMGLDGGGEKLGDSLVFVLGGGAPPLRNVSFSYQL